MVMEVSIQVTKGRAFPPGTDRQDRASLLYVTPAVTTAAIGHAVSLLNSLGASACFSYVPAMHWSLNTTRFSHILGGILEPVDML
jgi:hypothetical protein